MVEGFHRGFKTRVNRPKPSVQEYVRAVKEQQVLTDFHLDRLSVGKTPSKRRRTCHTQLHEICSLYSTYPNKLEYLFALAKYFGTDIERFNFILSVIITIELFIYQAIHYLN